jgi:benzoyl-CoA reductase/2-hydroxyglutaryl-CoA dehydratase subunit BcrC/BadD/HgdB
MTAKEIIQETFEILKSPYDYVKLENDPDVRYFGFNCIYVPEEILHAAGFVPIRLFGCSDKISFAEKYIPSHCCELVRGMISGFDRNVFNFLEAAAFGFCCDTMQVASNIIMERFNVDIFEINVPAKLDHNFAKKYLIQEINEFRNAIENRFKVSLDKESLNQSLEIYQENNRLMLELKDISTMNPGLISGAARMCVQSLGSFIPKEAHNHKLKTIIDWFRDESWRFEKQKQKQKQKKKKIKIKRVLAAGYIQNNMALLKEIEHLGVSICDDDLCEVSRCLTFEKESDKEPVDAIADRILSRFCPGKQKYGEDFADVLIKKYRKSCADGIIIFLPRFCDPQHLEYAATRYKLEQADVPFMIVDPTGIENILFGQIETRIEAFIEKI